MITNIPFFDDPNKANIVELKNIRQAYPTPDGKEVVVIDGLNLLIEDIPNQGQFISLLGKSGCGKSTVLNYIAGLQTPTSGEILLHGVPKKESDVVGMVFQQYSSFEWMSVLENVMLPLEFKGVPKKESRERAMAMIAEVGLSGHEHKYAQTPTLSGGQLQRVAIARSLVSNPDIILMDEPFGALDAVTRHQIQILLAKLWETYQSTVIFVTHSESEAVFLSDQIMIMAPNPGRIIREIKVDLPFHRDKSTKRTPRFTELVREVEDSLEFSITANG
ncbi:MAG: ABC transporter ATP-binding protein [Minisyncoccia bacterium]